MLLALLAVLSVSAATSATTAGAKTATAAAKKKAKKKKTTKKKTTKRATTTTAKKSQRIIGSPTGDTATTLKARPTDYDPNAELNVTYAAPPSSLDPAKNSGEYFTNQLYDRLTYASDDLQIQPMLATSWRYPDAHTLEMTLRSDVTFEDGTKFDAAAVKANIVRSQTLAGSILTSVLKGISSVEVVSPSVVRFHLSSGGAELPAVFAGSPGMMISPKVIASGVSLDTGPHGGGSGPWTVDSFTPNDRVVYKQSRMVQDGTYWDKAAGLIKKMTWIYLATSPQRINAVRSGDVDLAQVTGVDTYPAKQLIKSGGYSGRDLTLQTTQVSLYLRSTRPPLDNKTFRQALAYAIDKEALAKGLYNGDCDPAQQFYTSRHWAHSAAVDNMFKFDHDKAQQLIKQSGIFNPTFTIVYVPLYEAPAQAIQGMLGDYGINVKLQPVAGGDLSFRDGQADASISTLSPNGGLDPSTLINQFYLGVFNMLPDPDGSVAKATAAASDPTISQAQAAKLYDGIFQKIADASVTVNLCNTHQVWFQKGKVANLNDFGLTFGGRVDPRYLYVKK
ncbi:MAG: hypothetical protein JF603_12225 [Acidobacteria bacterium]|nr:hypothetical protein [Acidobacteriota bacterium]